MPAHPLWWLEGPPVEFTAPCFAAPWLARRHLPHVRPEAWGLRPAPHRATRERRHRQARRVARRWPYLVTEVGAARPEAVARRGPSGVAAMKPAVDEMFPEGAGPYVDLDEVRWGGVGGAACEVGGWQGRAARPRPGRSQRLLSQAGGSTGLLMDLAANEKAVHADFFNGKGRRAPGVGRGKGSPRCLPARRGW